MNQPKQLNLPSKKSVEDAIRVFEGFQDMCRHQLDVGYWATVDFPSKHHINRLLNLGWCDEKNHQELVYAYGEGLARHISELVPAVKGYVAFTRDARQPPQTTPKGGPSGPKVEG